MTESLLSMLSDRLLKWVVSSFHNGMVDMIVPPTLDALEKGSTSHSSDADVTLACWLASDHVDRMVSVRPLLSPLCHVSLQT
jgi:hypothetical protein